MQRDQEAAEELRRALESFPTEEERQERLKLWEQVYARMVEGLTRKLVVRPIVRKIFGRAVRLRRLRHPMGARYLPKMTKIRIPE